MEKYIPDMYQENIYKINYDKLKDKGIKCLLFDLDNTIVPYYEKVPRLETKELFDSLKAKEFKIVIFSNSSKSRLKPFMEQLNVDASSSCRKPFKKAFIKFLNNNKYEVNEVAIIGDQLLTDIRGGNKVGIMTILVKQLEEKDPIWTKINRYLENIVIKKLRSKNLFKRGKYYD